MKKTALILAIAALSAIGTLRAQSPVTIQTPAAITIAGGDCSNTTGSISFSCGEVATQYANQVAFTVVNITESFTEGVQQPYTERDKNANGITPLAVNLNVYPNPATDCVNIESEGIETLHYTLYNNNGQLMTEGECNGNEKVEMSSYATGNYILRVASSDNQNMNVYKIVLVR